MAKNWMSQAELQKDSAIYAKWVLVTAGVAAWDVLSTLPFDWSIISGKRKWRWPMALYFIARILMLLHIFAFAVNLNAIAEIPCQQVVWISKIADGFGTPCATFILVMRTVAVWQKKKYVYIPLGLLWVGHLVLWFQTFRYSKSGWNAQRHQCVVEGTAPPYLIVTVFSFTMGLDFIIMCLCSFKLWKHRTHSGLQSLLFRDGLVYFVAAFGANLLQTILAALALNPVMNIIALPFALVVSVIAATSVFRNVFMLYDDFAGNSSPNTGSHGASGANPIHTIGGTGRGTGYGRGRGFSTSKSGGVGADSFALTQPQHSRSGLGGIEVTRVVDIERDAVHFPNSGSRPELDDETSDSWTDREEKKSHLPL